MMGPWGGGEGAGSCLKRNLKKLETLVAPGPWEHNLTPPALDYDPPHDQPVFTVRSPWKQSVHFRVFKKKICLHGVWSSEWFSHSFEYASPQK